MTSRTIDNFEFLKMVGLIEETGGMFKISPNALVLKDDSLVDLPDLPKSKVFRFRDLFSVNFFTKEDLEKALRENPYLKYLRVLLPLFSDRDGVITHKEENWLKFKAWRFDIDYLYTEEQIEKFIKTLPLIPNVVKRSNKGWHIVYVFNEFITREAYERYKKLYNDFGNDKPEDIALQFLICELLTNYLTTYMEISASNMGIMLDPSPSRRKSHIATRFISESLPAYLIREPYTLKEFYEAYKNLIFEIDTSENNYSPYTIQSIPKEIYYSLKDRCGVLKALDEDWENHRNREWYVMQNYYAIDILYADTPEEKNRLKREYHEKSARHSEYKEEEAEYRLQYYIKKQSQGLKPPGCGYIYNNLQKKYTNICETCPYRKVDKEGRIFGHFIFDGLKQDSLESIHINNWELREDGWYYYTSKEMEVGEWIRVLPYFKIKNHYIVGKEQIEFVEIVDKKGIITIKEVKRNKEQYTVSPDLIKKYGYIDIDKIKIIKRFLTHYIEKVKEHRGINIDFLGYRFVNGFWDIAVGGYGNYRRHNLGLIFYGQENEQETDQRWFIPSIEGREDYFKAIYYQAFTLNDEPLHLIISHNLSWIGKQFIRDRSLKPNINPVLILVGDTGTGKSLRAKIGAGLFGNPEVFSFTNNTSASFNNRFPLIKTPFSIDEVMTKTQKDEVKLGELLYNITNIQGKMTFNNTYNPIDVPVLLTGETENLLIDKLFNTYRGLNRRSIVIEITTKWKDNAETLDNILNELQTNYGHILGYVKSLTDKDREEIERMTKRIYNDLKFGDSSFKDLKKHLALSLAMFKHFYKNFIGYMISDKEIDEKIEKVIKFVEKQINQHQLNKVGENSDITEEIVEFISKVKEIKGKGVKIKGFSYSQVCRSINYTPSHKAGEILKKFFWKTYTLKSGTRLVFQDDSFLLLDNPEVLTSYDDIIVNDINRIKETFTTSDLSIFLDVVKRIFGEKISDKVIQALKFYKVDRDERFKNLLTEDNNDYSLFLTEPEEVEI